MTHLLLPTDFSDHSLNACTYALALFGDSAQHITLVHSYMDPLPGYATMVDMTSVLYAASVEGLAEFAARLRGLPGAGHAVISQEVIYGPLATGLADLARSKAASLIIMGTLGASDMALFGSNASAVAKASHIPVLIVPKDARFQGLRRILFADDHTSVEPLAMGLMVDLARQHGAEILVGHVLRDAAEEPDARIVADYDAALSDVKYRYTDGTGNDVALALSELAECEHSDMVAVLHRHTGFLESLFHGSVAKQLAMHSRTPLLVLEH